MQASQGWRQESSQSDPLGPIDRSKPLQPSSGHQCQLHALGIGKQVVEDQSLEKGGLLSRDGCFLERDFERLDHSSILNPGWTCGLTGTAVQAKFEVLTDAWSHLQPTIGHGPHKIDPASWAVILVACLHVSRTTCGTETAMHAFLITPIGNFFGEPIKIDR